MKSEKRKGAKGKGKFRCPRTNVILWRYFALFAVSIIVVVTIVSYVVLGNSFISQQTRRVKAIGQELTQIVNDPDVSPSVKESKLGEYALFDNVTVFIIGEDGNIYYPRLLVVPEGIEEVAREAAQHLPVWERAQRRNIPPATAKTGRITTFHACATVPQGQNFLSDSPFRPWRTP